MADARVDIEVLYSDHGGNLILVVDETCIAERVSKSWIEGRQG